MGAKEESIVGIFIQKAEQLAQGSKEYDSPDFTDKPHGLCLCGDEK